MQSLHHRGIFRGNTIAEWLRAVGRRNPGGVQQIFPAPRNSVQRTAIFAARDLLVGLLRLLEASSRVMVMTHRSFGLNFSSRSR